MSHIDDLSAFLAERCRLYVLPAQTTRVAAVLRRGPSRWWRVSLWDRRTDRIEGGQWLHGKLYPEKCDLSPNGELLLYFGGKFRARDIESGYGTTYSAVSRVPYLTALALWPNSSTWGGGGVFVDDGVVALRQSTAHHPDHPPGPLRVVGYNVGDPRHQQFSSRRGWTAVVEPPAQKRISAWRKSAGAFTLERVVTGKYYFEFYPGREGGAYSLSRPSGEAVASFRAHWADFDSEGEFLAAAGGRLFRGRMPRKCGPIVWSEVASLASEQFTRVAAPDWAARW